MGRMRGGVLRSGVGRVHPADWLGGLQHATGRCAVKRQTGRPARVNFPRYSRQELVVTQNVVVAVVLGVAIVVMVGGFVMVPALQNPEQAANAQASERVEEARRLLHQYQPYFERSEELRAELRSYTDLDDEVVIDVDFEDPEELLEYVEADYQEEYEGNWEAYEPVDFPAGKLAGDPRPAGRPNFGNLPGQIRSGVSERSKVATENQKLLAEALRVVGEAMNVSVGDASARTHIEANRLKAVILEQQAAAGHLESLRLRRAVEPYRRQVVRQAQRVARLQQGTEVVTTSHIDDEIVGLEQRAAEQREVLQAAEAELAGLDEQVAGLEKQLQAAQQRADEARDALADLDTKGIDLSGDGSAEAFASEYERWAQQYREALGDVAGLEFGRYVGAEIDASGDYLTGQYQSATGGTTLEREPGLRHYQNERAVAALRVDGARQGLEALQASLDQLTDLKAQYGQAEQNARQQLTAARELGAAAYDQWKTIESEAEAAEDEVLDLLVSAAESAEAASRAAETRLSDDRERAGEVSAEARQYSAYEQRSQNQWLAGHIEAQVADADLMAASVYYDRYRCRMENARVLDAVADYLTLAEADAEGERAVAMEAREAGIERVVDAVEELQRVHRSTDGLWTVAAQAASVKHLLVLFGMERYAREVADSYRAAIEGREDDPAAEPFAAMLRQLQRRRR